MTWQPIDSAPKDGEVLAWSPTMERSFIVCWRDFMETPDWQPVEADYSMLDAEDQPTHWMPLPDPPE